MRIGIIGISEGNGHPFSFSAIINGYSDEGFARSGWAVIHDYLRKRPPEDFGFEDVRVTHAWTQHREVTRQLAEASRIEHVVAKPEDMIGEVDAVIIARDDVASHLPLALPFLTVGIPVFVDKPLAIAPQEVEFFRKYLEEALLMSCSGLRFAVELDAARAAIESYGRILRIDTVVVNNWQTYGVHMLDAAFGLISARPRIVQRAAGAHDSLAIMLDDDTILNVAALGPAKPCFHFSIYGTEKVSHHDLRDNFAAFRRTLAYFIDMVRTRVPPIPPRDTILSMRTIAAGLDAPPGKERIVSLD